MKRFPTFKGSWPWHWPWIGSYCIPSCITHQRLPTHWISLKWKKPFVDGRTDGRTNERTDGHLRPALLGGLWRVDLKGRRYVWRLITKLVSKALSMARVKGITQIYLPPTCLSTNGMSHPAFTPSRRALTTVSNSDGICQKKYPSNNVLP